MEVGVVEDDIFNVLLFKYFGLYLPHFLYIHFFILSQASASSYTPTLYKLQFQSQFLVEIEHKYYTSNIFFFKTAWVHTQDKKENNNNKNVGILI